MYLIISSKNNKDNGLMSNADWKPLYPFATHSHDVGGVRMNYVDEGQGDPILFVHGNPTWSFAWRNLILKFRDRYRCIAVDHIGCGLSDKPQDYPYTLAQHIANLKSLIEKLDLKKITLVVHDWGGAIGIGTLGKMPERFSRVVITNTAAFPSKLIPWRIAACRIPVLGRIGVRGLNLFAGLATTMATENPQGLPADVKAGYLAPYDNWANRVAVDRFVNDIPMSPRHQTYPTILEVESALDHVRKMPTQLIWGMKDWCFSPAFYKEFRTRLPEARFVELNDAGHYLFEDGLEPMSQTIEKFLSETPRSGE